MTKTSNKRYTVWEGKKRGIFDNWKECQQSVSGYKNAKYKSFGSKQEAEKAFSESYELHSGKKNILTSTTFDTSIFKGSIAVDAACSGNPGILEFRGVETLSQKIIFSYGPYHDATVNIGEFLALIEGIKYCISISGTKNQCHTIYSDSRTAIARVREQKVQTTLEPSLPNSELFIMLDEAIERLHAHTKIIDFDKNHVTIQQVGTQYIESDNKPNTIEIHKRNTALRGEIPADYNRK